MNPSDQHVNDSALGSPLPQPGGSSPAPGPRIPGTLGEHIGSRMFDRWAVRRANVVRAATLATARVWPWFLLGLTILLLGLLIAPRVAADLQKPEMAKDGSGS